MVKLNFWSNTKGTKLRGGTYAHINRMTMATAHSRNFFSASEILPSLGKAKSEAETRHNSVKNFEQAV
jgi:hypothetical protein